MRIIIMVFFLSLLTNIKAQTRGYALDTVIDLNGDKLKENISVKIFHSDTSDFIFTVNGRSITGVLEMRNQNISGFKIVDLNKNDKYKEIAVYSSGPSSDDDYHFYGYDSSVFFMNHIFESLTFSGNGIVYGEDWKGFWIAHDKYILNNETRKLEHIKQFAYYVGTTVKTIGEFEIYREKELINKVALVSKDSEITLLLCDNKDIEFYDMLYLVKTKTQLLGWAKFREIYDNIVPLDMAD
ncbi:MAG TPA: hypothetical protein DCE80_03315 [Ignavibacteriales bacterium]|nr:hypothetical protein [Ignavibacteriales bacterium]